ncbi:hypothetical protein TRFO_20094 [Tritrichomonas foetus]|uniref:Choline transporter-like protein n=1 Tax=Tritrichomonas foetus TaxID=1144522 RepID=A0A1J4KMJ0_9EUKA|nr:hypothetical protein TRFO_20094 [Tritrichomonas foetus]|eukprot:OHT10589.1 hypothetical protein TRFO_20094 [Tritrichomonas foetus]
MSLLLNEESNPYIIASAHRVKTDSLCFHFSWPIILAILQIFIFVAFFGSDFSIIHPPDQNGLRCGVNNAKYGKGLLDNKNLILLSYSGECVRRCNGKKFMSYCIPSDKKLLAHSTKSFKAAADFSVYVSFAFILIGILIVLSLPIYFLFIKSASLVSLISLISLIVLFSISTIYEIIQKEFLIACFIASIGIFYVLFNFYLRKRINSIHQIVTASFSIIKKNKSIFLAPFFILVFIVMITIFVLFGVILSEGVSDPIPLQNGLRQSHHQSLTATTALFPVIGLWFSEFIIAWVRSAISLIISSSYFQIHAPTFSEALGLIAHFHTGTMLVGSFIIFCLEQLSNFFIFIRQKMATTKNTFVKFLCKCILNVCFCCVQFAGEVNRLSFVYTAVKGVSFWDGCKKASNALKIESVLNMDLLLNNVLLSIRVLLSFISLVVVFIYQQKIELYLPMIPIIWIPMTVYIALASIDITIGASSETILVCLCEDVQSNEYHGPKDLENILKYLKEKVVQETFNDDIDTEKEITQDRNQYVSLPIPLEEEI